MGVGVVTLGVGVVVPVVAGHRGHLADPGPVVWGVPVGLANHRVGNLTLVDPGLLV